MEGGENHQFARDDEQSKTSMIGEGDSKNAPLPPLVEDGGGGCLDLSLGLSLGGLYNKGDKNPKTTSLLDYGMSSSSASSSMGVRRLEMQTKRSASPGTGVCNAEIKRPTVLPPRPPLPPWQRSKELPPSKVTSIVAASTAKNPRPCRALDMMKAFGEPYSEKKILTGTGYTTTQHLLPQQGTGYSDRPFSVNSIPAFNPDIGKPVRVRSNISASNNDSEQIWNQSNKKLKALPVGTVVDLKKSNYRDDIDGLALKKQTMSVTATGDGPEGKRVEGLLYIYGIGQITIVCVCHGVFLSPANFVKHAGCTDLADPMKHIKVCQTRLPFQGW